MNRKQRGILALGLAAAVLLAVALYPHFGKRAITARIYGFLSEDGYAETEIASVDVRHSYIGALLGYGQWHTSIYFADEPHVEYHGILDGGLFPKITSVTAGGFSSKLPEDYVPLHDPK